MGEMTEDERMVKVHDVIQQLPPPHYRYVAVAEFLFEASAWNCIKPLRGDDRF